VPADLERDRDAILGVWNRNLSLSPELNREKLRWYYQENPCGPGHCWLLVTEPDGTVVGTAGLGLRRVRVGEETLLAGVASDYAVDKEHRSLQPALMLQKAVLAKEESDLPLIYGLPNRNAIAIFRRLGYREVGTLQRHAKVLRVGPYLRRLSGAARALALFGEPIDWARAAVAAETWQPAGGKVLRELDGADGRFDELWERVAPQRAVAGERSADFVRWRYQECPLREYSVLGLFSRDESRLHGYAVTFLEGEQLQCVDLVAEDNDATLDALVAGLLRRVRNSGASSISLAFYAPGPLEEKLRAYGFVPRPGGDSATTLMAHLDPESGGERAELLRQWCFLPGDEDFN
jgi:hypothetical protein